ncbi:hypothetical protein MIND_01128400 [Mycena indigotica]|uniref:Uncharacterized protein n=1 Tax=Mycena indigotica TaxID=2126181 RepID=A0A8H6VTN3_9AGAR|nr:uncharacterized protein MIND_01128400 [Mycena indigotica]KAF7293504.1 hypothetical protein MIND_01128400 [Mycena indigotica]
MNRTANWADWRPQGDLGLRRSHVHVTSTQVYVTSTQTEVETILDQYPLLPPSPAGKSLVQQCQSARLYYRLLIEMLRSDNGSNGFFGDCSAFFCSLRHGFIAFHG